MILQNMIVTMFQNFGSVLPKMFTWSEWRILTSLTPGSNFVVLDNSCVRTMPKNMCHPVKKNGNWKCQMDKMALFDRICGTRCTIFRYVAQYVTKEPAHFLPLCRTWISMWRGTPRKVWLWTWLLQIVALTACSWYSQSSMAQFIPIKIRELD